MLTMLDCQDHEDQSLGILPGLGLGVDQRAQRYIWATQWSGKRICPGQGTVPTLGSLPDSLLDPGFDSRLCYLRKKCEVGTGHA